MTRGELALAFLSGGLGFAVADFADRYFATYNPAGTGTPPTNLFTAGSGQSGTLANTLNIASPPGLLRIGVGIGVTVVPALGAYLVKNPLGRAALQGMMIGAGIKLFSTLWNAYVMGNLLKPANTQTATLQSSLGARVYPAEIVAAANISGNTLNAGSLNPGLAAAPQGVAAPPPQQYAQPRQGVAAPPRRAQQQRFAPQRQGVAGDPGPFAVGQASPCPAGQVADQLTGACSAPCPDGSAPSGGQCAPGTPQTQPGCPQGQVVDSNGNCQNPCPDGSAPDPVYGCMQAPQVPVQGAGPSGSPNFPAPQPQGPQNPGMTSWPRQHTGCLDSNMGSYELGLAMRMPD